MPLSPNRTGSPSALPRIHLLATGGTIAATPAPDGQTRYTAGALSPQALIDAVPGLSAIATLAVEQIASVGSQNISLAIWVALTQRLAQLQADPAVDGVVITHGTDTLEETAFFLSLLVPRHKPVVLVGAMRPAHALSADGPGNLLRAIALASHRPAAPWGALVLMNDSIHLAAQVQKTSASGIQAFASPNSGPVGLMQGIAPVFLHAGALQAAVPILDPFRLDAAALPPVAIVHGYAGQTGQEVRDAARWAEGIVLAGVGEGNATDEIWQAVREAIAAGVHVVRSSRCVAGMVARNGEIDDNVMGTVACGLLNAPKARILLMLALLDTRDVRSLQEIFDRNGI